MPPRHSVNKKKKEKKDEGEREEEERSRQKREQKEEGRERQGGVCCGMITFVKKLRNRIYSTQVTTHTCSGILRESAGGKGGGRISA